ncbi:MAG: copper resistance protein B [Acidobacteria bacterium]|nr:copper resistance protein B [Acidobacteriota bacterium]
MKTLQISKQSSERTARTRSGHRWFTLAALCSVALLGSVPVSAQEPASVASSQEHGAANDPAVKTNPRPAEGADVMAMGPMQGGGAPPDARDPDAYSGGYEHTPGMGHPDSLAVGLLLADELEYLSGNEGQGANWHLQGTYGGDIDKLWLRTQGLAVERTTDPTTGVEALWWHGYSAFWGTLLGVRQDVGPGSHTWLAFGTVGLSPYWFELQATGYVGDDGRLSARLKASYDLLFTNRLILVPGLESNVYSRAESDRALAAGVGNVEFGLRLRYEFSRKFAPYIGYVWERSFAGTADLRRADGEPVTEHRLVAGVRVWR